MSEAAQPMVEPADFPALFQAANQVAIDGQRRYKRLASLELILLVSGAVAGTTLAVVGGRGRVGATIGGLVFLGALAIRLLTRKRADDAAWFDGRAVAETVKTDTWRYIAGTPPFDGPDADRKFGERLGATLRARPGIVLTRGHMTESAQQITPTMRRLRELPRGERHRLYLRERLDDQVKWYGRSAERHARASRRWATAALSAEVAAIMSAVLIFFSTDVADLGLLGLFGSIAAAFAAWNQLGRHGELAKAYALAYQELLTIRSIHDVVDTDEDLARMVDDGEGAVSREHTMWMAKRTERPQSEAT